MNPTTSNRRGGEQRAAVLACVNVGMESIMQPPYEPGPTHEKVPCDECGRLMWLGPKQKAARIAYDFGAFCVVCLTKQAAKEGALENIPLISKTMDEFSHKDFDCEASSKDKALSHFRLAKSRQDVPPFFAAPPSPGDSE